MIPRKLKLFFAFFPYAGNGGYQSEHPAIRNWFAKTLRMLSKDERIESVEWNDFADTPITMTRNAAVLEARKRKADVIIMIDSDMHPDHALEVDKDPRARPFIPTAFDKIYEHYEDGPLVIACPYCGAPFFEENVFAFHWTNRITNNPNRDWKLEAVSRAAAQQKTGFEEMGALATGAIMCDMRIFEITEPKDEGEKPWFYYEYRDKFEGEKISTEDVTFTRDISLMGSAVLGYNPLLICWDSWWGHYKPKCVGKPHVATADTIAKKHARAYAEALDSKWADVSVGAGEGLTLDVPQEIVKKFLALHGKPPQGILPDPDPSVGPQVGPGVFAPEDLIADRVEAFKAAGAAPTVGEKHYHPLPEIEESVARSVTEKTWIVDFGGNKTHRFSKAKQTCGWEGQKKADFDTEKLPYKTDQVNFAYCRHTVEDLGNPGHFLKELRRVSKRGYIETPSPMAEVTRGVAGPGVGYIHHRWIVWSENGVLNLIPKYSLLETKDWFNFAPLLNSNKFAWNTYHLFGGKFLGGKLKFKIWSHEKDFRIDDHESYRKIIAHACEVAMEEAKMFDEDLGQSPAAVAFEAIAKAPETTTGLAGAGIVSAKPFNFLGHVTPPTDLLALQKLVKDQLSRETEGTVHVCEIGSYVGSSAIAMAEVDKRVQVRCIEHFRGNDNDRIGAVTAEHGSDKVRATFRSNVANAGLDGRIVLDEQDETNVVGFTRNEAYHVVFLDAKHDYETVKRQIDAWMPKVKKNGILCGHDYCDAFPGVMRAVNELQAQGVQVRRDGNVWWTRAGHVCLGRAGQVAAVPGLH